MSESTPPVIDAPSRQPNPFSTKKGTIKGVSLIFGAACAAVAAIFVYHFQLGFNAGKQRAQDTKQRMAANLNDWVEQATNGSFTQVKPSGNYEMDGAMRAVAAFSKCIGTAVTRMEEEIAALQMRAVSEVSVLHTKASLEIEIRKRIQSQKIVERCHLELPSVIEQARLTLTTALAVNNTKKEFKEGVLEALQQKTPEFETRLRIRLRMEKAEFDFLSFLAAVFDDFKFTGDKISFGSAENIGKYDQLATNIVASVKEFEEFQKRQLDSVEEGKRKLLQGLGI